MLATLVRKPFDEPGWVYEEKYDGFRILAYKEGDEVTLLSRNGKDRTHSFANIAEAVRKLKPRTLLLDGEAITFDPEGVSRFQLLQESSSAPQYAVFDCLYRDGRDFRPEPLTVRRAALEEVVAKTTGRRAAIFRSAILDPDGLKAFDIAKKSGYEGVLAKDESAPYVEGRSDRWLKFKVHQEDEFVIVGYTAPAGSRKHLGALLLGAYRDGELRYVGKVGTGFTERRLSDLSRSLKPLVASRPAVVNPPRERDVTYVAPRLVAQISYQEMTADQKLRQPVFLGLRDDKNPRDVTIPEPK